MNMGTPMYPESVPHWSNKVMWKHILELRRRRQQGFWMFFDTCCGRCEAGGYVENIMDGVTAVRMEAEYGGYRPDILLERGDKRPLWLEVTHTSPPSEAKLAYCSDNGIDLFELDGSREPVKSSIARVHISPQNCRAANRARLYELWEHMASVEDPVIGIREDFRSRERQETEKQAFIEEVTGRSQTARDGRVSCIECGRRFASEGDAISFSGLEVHHPERECGWVPVCCECLYDSITQAAQPGSGIRDLDAGCADCAPYLAEREKDAERTAHLRSIAQSEGTYTRMIHEPDWERIQSYFVGERTVRKEEMQAMLMSFKLIFSLPQQPPQIASAVREEVEAILAVVNYPNNIRDWDWLGGVGESYQYGYMNNGDMGNRFLYPWRLWGGQAGEFPPDPLKDLDSLIRAMSESR